MACQRLDLALFLLKRHVDLRYVMCDLLPQNVQKMMGKPVICDVTGALVMG